MIEVLSVASEIYPLVKTGGLADVTGALPAALAPLGITMRSLVPGYPSVMGALENAQTVADIDSFFGGTSRVLAGRAGGLDLFVVDAPQLYDRPGNPYLGPDGFDWPDNWRRFAGLSYVAGRLANGLVPNYVPQVVHAHDWQAGLAPAYVKYGMSDQVRSVMTIHNLAFQGNFGSDIFGQLYLPPHAFGESLEYYGGVSFIKAALQTADVLTTVSPTYAQEIRTAAYGMGLEGLLQARSADLYGILNGIDTGAWDPAIDPDVPQNYSAATIHKREENKRALHERFNLEPGAGPLFGIVSRLTWQKGMDMLVASVDGLVAQGGMLCILGSGETEITNGLMGAAMRHPGKVGIVANYDEKLAHVIQGGADVILVPSRFEPCGLTQLIGLRYGCVPVVSRVGGLADTVIDANEAAIEAGVSTGLQFAPATEWALADAIRRTIEIYRDEKTWRKMQRRGMKSNVSWGHSAQKYARLYANLAGVAAA
jgi:starch synthase